MPRFAWGVNNFSLGMHTEPARAGEGSERFALDAAGLRADGNGHLRPRVAFQQFGESGVYAVTGVVAGADYLLSLRSDASLWIRFAASPDVESAIIFDTPSNLTGALSLIDEYDDFAIVKGQGGSAFWIDMREDAPTFLHANRLGLEPPVQPPNTQYLVHDDMHAAVIIIGFIYFYRWTYVRAYGDTDEKIRDDEIHHEGVLFGGMESNPSEPLGFYVTLGAEPLKADLVDDEGNPVTRVYPIGGQYSRINFTNWHHSTDPQVTGIMLYQSEPVETSIDGRVNVDALEYRRIAYIPRDKAEEDTGQTATADVWATKPLLRTDNDVLPPTERIHLYNDRIFAPTENGLRFSDVDGTILRLWAYPEVNAIHRSGVRDCVAHRGVLLFGGATDMHSVAGTGPYNYVVNRLGSVGPVSAHAMQVLKDTVAFVGAAGFYATDGVNVQKLSDALDSEFEEYRVTYGHCHQLPDDSWIFVAQQVHVLLSPRRVAFHFDGGWFSWPRFNIHQIARWRVPGVRVMLADESPALRELVWKVTSDDADDDAMDSEDLIDWHWESQRLNFGSERL